MPSFYGLWQLVSFEDLVFLVREEYGMRDKFMNKTTGNSRISSHGGVTF